MRGGKHYIPPNVTLSAEALEIMHAIEDLQRQSETKDKPMETNDLDNKAAGHAMIHQAVASGNAHMQPNESTLAPNSSDDRMQEQIDNAFEGSMIPDEYAGEFYNL